MLPSSIAGRWPFSFDRLAFTTQFISPFLSLAIRLHDDFLLSTAGDVLDNSLAQVLYRDIVSTMSNAKKFKLGDEVCIDPIRFS